MREQIQHVFHKAPPVFVCQPRRCSYVSYSLACFPCESHQFSTSGLSCELCAAGNTANLAQDGCRACPNTTAGTDGVCNLCAPGRVVR